MQEDYYTLRAKADIEYSIWTKPEKSRIDFAYDTSSIASGIDDIISKVNDKITSNNYDIDTGIIAGYGFQYLNPLAQITFTDGTTVLYGPINFDNIDDLIQKADMAMYVSKTQGKDKFTLYNDEINEKMLEKLNLEIQVRKKLHQINKK